MYSNTHACTLDIHAYYNFNKRIYHILNYTIWINGKNVAGVDLTITSSYILYKKFSFSIIDSHASTFKKEVYFINILIK